MTVVFCARFLASECRFWSIFEARHDMKPSVHDGNEKNIKGSLQSLFVFFVFWLRNVVFGASLKLDMANPQPTTEMKAKHKRPFLVIFVFFCFLASEYRFGGHL